MSVLLAIVTVLVGGGGGAPLELNVLMTLVYSSGVAEEAEERDETEEAGESCEGDDFVGRSVRMFRPGPPIEGGGSTYVGGRWVGGCLELGRHLEDFYVHHLLANQLVYYHSCSVSVVVWEQRHPY